MKIIRWSGLIAFVVIVGLITLFNVLFLDNIIKVVVEDRASIALGARVDIGDLRFSLLGLNVVIRDLQVASPEQPTHNVVEVRALALDLAALPLLKKKFVVQRMKVVDLAWDTPRQTSGVLPPRLQKRHRKASDAGIKARKGLEDCVLPDFSIFEELKEGVPEDLLADTTLPSAVFLSAHRQEVSEARASWDQRLAHLPTKKEIETALVALKDLKDKRPKEAAELPGYLEKVKAAQQELVNIRKGLIEARRDFQKEIKTLRNSLKGARKLKGEDFKAVWAQLDIRVPTAGDLICVLLGKDLAIKVNRTIAWYRRLNRFITPRGETEEAKARPAPRLKGTDVRFPITGGYPKFLLEVAEFSALPAAETGSERFAFARLSGELQGLTPQPALYGKPTVFRFKGDLVGERPGELTLFGELDHRKTPTDDRIDLTIKDFNLERSGKSNTAQRSLLLTSAFLDVDASLQITDEKLDGQARVSVREANVEVGSEAGLLADLFKNLGPFEVNLSIGGTLDQPVMGLTSSATKTLSAPLQRIFRTKQKELRRTLKRAINARINRELSVANDEVDAYERRILDELSSRLTLAGPVSQEHGKEKKPSKN